MAIYPYATLSADPLTQFDLHWLNEDADDETVYTVSVRVKGTTPWVEVSDTIHAAQMTQDGDDASASDPWFFYCHITGLKTNTVYEALIDDGTENETVEFQTLPRRLHRRDLTVVVANDMHIRRTTTGAWNNDTTKMDLLTAHDPDLFILAGDWLTNAVGPASFDGANPPKYVDWVKNFLPRLDNQGKLVPIFYVPGNHEGGNYFWVGTTADVATLPIIPELDVFLAHEIKTGRTKGFYNQIKISNYLNLIGLDTHNAYADEQGEWLDANINKDARISVAFYHNPMLVVGNRTATEFTLGENCLSEWMPAFWDAENVWLGLSGNIHVRKATKKLQVQASGGTNTLSLKDGRNVGESSSTTRYFVELGEGWACDKTVSSKWYTDYAQAGEEHYQVITVSKNSHSVEDIRIDGENDTFNFPYKRLKIDKAKALLV